MDNEPYVDFEDVAKHFSVCVSTVRKWVKHGTIPVLKLDKVSRCKISEVEKALREATEGAVEVKKEVDPRQLEINFDPEEDF